jgi:hypothetical protein
MSALEAIGVVLDRYIERELPELYSFSEHHRRFARLEPAGRLAAFLELPSWQQQQAWDQLRLELDREQGGGA